MDREHLKERIEALREKGRVPVSEIDRLEQLLQAEQWPALMKRLTQLEVESRFASWRPIVRLAMMSSLISAAILIALAVWVAQHPEVMKTLQSGDTSHGQHTGD